MNKAQATKKTELLAPAGSLDICKAVINAGADAVYLGGKSFSARAYAGNLTNEEIREALDYAHLRGANIYLTLNTLIKEKELKNILPFLNELYRSGLDAVIVQDYGCVKLIREELPKLNVHASTQMAVMTEFFANKLKALGVGRVVLPREMTLEEISQIKASTGMELEVFVHGALCYSYSGLCLFSSMHGTRSGNRGSCAQPCRLLYTAEAKRTRLLSPKDIAALKLIPEIINAGADSLKIEGRMKNIYYAAGVTSIYRKYIDSFFAGKNIEGSEYREDLDRLASLYNRGSFSQGLFYGFKGAEQMSLERPNNQGVAALKVIANKRGHLTLKAIRDINAGDIFEAGAGNYYTSGRAYKKDESFEVDLPVKYGIRANDVLHRMNSSLIQDEISKGFIENRKKINIKMELKAYKESPALLRIIHPESGSEIVASGERVQAARASGVTINELKKRLLKLGNTDFVCIETDIYADNDIFISNGGVNELRRSGLEKITQAILNSHKRTLISEKYKKENFLFAINKKNDIIGGSMPERLTFSALVSNTRQAEAAIDSRLISRLYIPVQLIREASFLSDIYDRIRVSGKEFFIALPFFFRQRHIRLFKEDVELALKINAPNGFLVRSADQISALEGFLSSLKRKELKIVTDYQVYAYNSEALLFLTNLIKNAGFTPELFSAPAELSGAELKDIGLLEYCEASGYGKRVLMLSEHCVPKTLGKCSKTDVALPFLGEEGEEYTAQCDCRYCNNIIYDSKPVNLLKEYIDKTGLKRIRLDFTYESKEETLKILNFIEKGQYDKIKDTYHTGFYTGVL